MAECLAAAERRILRIRAKLGKKHADFLLSVYERLFNWVIQRPFPRSPSEVQDIHLELERANDMYQAFEVFGRCSAVVH